MREITITPRDANRRLDRFLCKYLNNAARSLIYKIIRKKQVKVNYKREKENYFIKENDTVQLYLSDTFLDELINRAPEKQLSQAQADLDIVFENDDILVVNKPAGLLTHPDKNEYKKTLTSRVHRYLKHLCTRAFKPAPVQRLDKNTGGLVLFCKNSDALKRYNCLMRNRAVKKYYRCIVHGFLEKAGEIKGYIHKDETRNRVTFSNREKGDADKFVHSRYLPVKTKKDFSLVEVELLTGRSHQIRASLAFIGHPIIGDTKYGGSKVKGVTTQVLHAYKILCEGSVYKAESAKIAELWEQL